MNRILIFLVLIPFLSMGQVKNAQFVDLKIAKQGYKKFEGFSKQFVVYNSGALTLAMKNDDRDVLLQIIDNKTMMEKKRGSVKLRKWSENVKIVETANNNFYLFYQVFNGRGFYYDIYYHKINMNTLTLDEEVHLTKIQGQELDYQLSTSNDKSKVLITCSKKYLEEVFLFDSNMDKLWSKKSGSGKINLKSFVYDDGSFYLFTFLSDGFYLLDYKPEEGLESKRLETGLKVKYRGLKVAEMSNGNYMCAGYYSNTSGGAAGVFSFVVSPEGKVLDSKKSKFTSDFINEYPLPNSEPKEDRNTIGISNLFSDRIVLDQKGNLILIGEASRSVKHYYDGQATFTETFINNVYVSKIDQDGDFVFNYTIPKYQFLKCHCIEKGYSAFAYNDFIYIITTQSSKDENIASGNSPKKVAIRASNVVLYRIGMESGMVQKQAITENRKCLGKTTTLFGVNRIFQVKEGQIMIEFTSNSNKDILLKLFLKD